MIKDIFAYKVLVWHRDDVRGTHHSILCSGATLQQVLKEFNKYMERPAQFRSFTSKNLVQVKGPEGFSMDILDI